MTLRAARLKAKLTQEELAEKSGVEQATISNLETGRVQSPQWDTVARLAEALDVDPYKLFPVEHREAV
jgi:transcriptional regulator with XRE-family HTH domain